MSDDRSVVAALALDQRGILRQVIAREQGVADVPDSEVIEFKKLGVSYAKHKPRMVALSVEEFSKREYATDMLKIEVPIEMRFVPGTSMFSGEEAYSRGAAQQNFRSIDSATSKPYVYLSAGVTNQQFVETLELAAESGSRFNGVLCGRATWQNGVRVFAQRGAKALEEWLETYGTQNITRVNQILKSAQPWTEKLD